LIRSSPFRAEILIDRGGRQVSLGAIEGLIRSISRE